MRLLLLWAFFSSLASAQVYGPQVTEHKFSIAAKFFTTEVGVANLRIEADRQLTHIFGVFASPVMIASYGLDPALVGGLGAIQYPIEYQITARRALADGTSLVSYIATGKILLHNQVSQRIKDGQPLSVPLPFNVNNYYDAKCTDKHYWLPSDFWYFFNPYSDECRYLSQPPMAGEFTLELFPATRRKLDMNLRLDLLRAHNGNGATFRLDIIHGFEDSATNPKDYGRAGFNEFNNYLRTQGYEEQVVQAFNNRPILKYIKPLKLNNGKTIQVEINSLLVESSIESKSITFAKFFKAAIDEADVVYYTGHSGLGATLDVAALEAKAGGFNFNNHKRQIYFFDSCSSYSYYLSPFRDEKTRARLDIVTNGLSSLFDTGFVVLTTFLEEITDPKVADKTWPEVLGGIEKAMNGTTFLLNVGGI